MAARRERNDAAKPWVRKKRKNRSVPPEERESLRQWHDACGWSGAMRQEARISDVIARSRRLRRAILAPDRIGPADLVRFTGTEIPMIAPAPAPNARTTAGLLGPTLRLVLALTLCLFCLATVCAAVIIN